MAQLSLSLLGPFQATLGGQPVTNFKSNKVRALLAYLAVEADQPHRREVLAALLWPDWPDRDALSNLRYALSDLRRAISDRVAEPPFLLITRNSIQFNTASDYSLDVAAFTDPASLDQAVALYRGSFLEGFSVGDSPAFEEWALFTRERLARQMSSALHRLAATCEQGGQYEQAQSYAWRQVELEPWDEAAHQRLMRALALSGQRGAALAQYETCRRLLAAELGVEPSAETTRLYQQIRDGELQAPALLPALAAELPSFFDAEPPKVERPVFVACECELAQLDSSLDLALAGQGRVVFVVGEAGSGKTSLVQEFTRRAQEVHAELVVASGNCNAHTGIGDPYLPFREILGLLTGDVETRWAVGAITREHARRLWNTLPLAAQALVEAGPDLIDTFVLRAALLERATACVRPRAEAGWVTHLREFRARGPATGPGMPGLQQSDLFEQYTRVLQTLARNAPLVLVVDDLQWADLGSISLLFHLGRQLAGSRVLIVGAYRAEEVASGRAGPLTLRQDFEALSEFSRDLSRTTQDGAGSGQRDRHPLASVVNELQRQFGDVVVNVDQAERRDFVEALLDSEPNQLGLPFRDMLYQQTRGHPLFTIELLRGMQERGDLVQDAEGRWVEGPALDWETLPARVEAAIAERIGRLTQPLRAALQVACVEGEDFTAEVIARVLRTDERDIVRRLSSQLDRRHRLVRAQVIERLGVRRVSRYRFRHNVFQKYLYDNLDPVERAYLHEDVGNALEGLYGDQESGIAAIAAIAVRLARHFQQAQITEKAIHYLHQAGERAVQLSAYQEGIAHLTRGLALLTALPDSPQRAQQELALQLTLGMAWRGPEAYGPEVEKACTRARELCQQTGKKSQLYQILGQLSIMHYVRAEYQTARELAEEELALAQQAEDPLLVALSHWHLGFILFSLGEYTTAHAHLEQMITFYEPQHHQRIVSIGGSDARLSAIAYDACCLWCLGYPEQALRRSQEALALARELDHPYSLVDVLYYAGCLLNKMRQDGPALKDRAEELMRLANEKGFPGWLAEGISFRGEALAMLGQVQEGMAQMREGMAAMQSIGVRLYLPETLGALAEAQAKTGHPEEGLATLAEALALVEETDERHWEAELYRLQAELLLTQGDDAGAEANLHKAIGAARRQQARSWELRATVGLCRLWQAQGKREQARRLLTDIYGWFSEGFDTPDLQEAQALLDELTCP